MTKNIILFITVAIILATGAMCASSAPLFDIKAPKGFTYEATGVTTYIPDTVLGTPKVFPPGTEYTRNPAWSDFPLGQTDIIWAVDNGAVTDMQTVIVTDTIAPVITVLGSDPVNINVGDVYTDAGATALDDVDGDITANIVTVNPVNTAVLGTYTVTYDVSDATGNPAIRKTRTVNVKAVTDTIAPVITVLGSDPVNINVGDVYTDAGATALDDVDGDITANIVTVNPVNTAVPGTYTVTYNVADAAGNPAIRKTRTVNVKAVADTTAPVIVINGISPVNINVGNVYTDAGATASDNIDGDITSSIVTVNPVDNTTIGTYTVTYDVSDAAGNPAIQKTRTVNVNTIPDTTAPVITVLGSDPVNINVGNVYTDAGATALDDVDGDITANIVTVNPVNTTVLGTYTVTYDVSDAAGNPAIRKTRIVNVKGGLKISANLPSVNVGQPTNVVFTVTRKCGIESSDNSSCVGTVIPVIGANVSLTGVSNGTGVTDGSGQTTISVNAASVGIVTATASYSSGYNDDATNITADVPAPPSTGGNNGGSNSGSSSIGGGGGGGGTGEPYDNILKYPDGRPIYDVQEHDVSTTPVSFRYTIPELGIYNVWVTSTQNGIAALRIETLIGTSKLVGFSAPGLVYKNINAWMDYKRIKNATMQFKVENSWIDNNGLPTDTIKMYLWDNASVKWTELATTVASKDDTYTYFDAQTTTFGSLAISGAITAPVATVVPSTPSATVSATDISPEPIATATTGNKGPTGLQIGIVAVVVVLVYYMLRMKKE